MFFLQLCVQGSTMGTRDELDALAQFMDVTGTRPLIDREIPMAEAASGLAELSSTGSVFGQIVLTL